MVKQLSDVYQISEVDGSALGITSFLRLYTFVNDETFDKETLEPSMLKQGSLSNIEDIVTTYFKQPLTVGDPRTGMDMPDGLWSILGGLISSSLDSDNLSFLADTKLLYDSSGFGTTDSKTVSYIKINADGSVDQVTNESVTDLTVQDKWIFMTLHDLSTEIQGRTDLNTKLTAYYDAGSEEAAHALSTGDPKHWNTEKVMDFRNVFKEKVSDYHPKLDNWTMTQATIMSLMFANSNYNHDLNCLERNLPTPSTLGNMTKMDCLFCENGVFNNGEEKGESSNPLLWKTDSTDLMMFMFGTPVSTPSIFNQRLGDDSETYFNTSNVTIMHGMFRLCVDFNQSINHFKTGNVDNTEALGFSGMKEMFFGATSFNNGGDMCIGDLDVSKVENFEKMFFGAVNFDQQINSWTVKETANLTNMIQGSGLFLNDTLNQGFKDIATPTVELFGKESMCVVIPLENAEIKALVSKITTKQSTLTSEHTKLKNLLTTVKEKNDSAAKFVKDNGLTDDDKEILTNLSNKVQQPWQKSPIGSDKQFGEAHANAYRELNSLSKLATLADVNVKVAIEKYTDLDVSAHEAGKIIEGAFLNQKLEMIELNKKLKNKVNDLDLSTSDETYVTSFIASLDAELLEIELSFALVVELDNIADTKISKLEQDQVSYTNILNLASSTSISIRTYPTRDDLINALNKWYEIANDSDVETANSYIGPEYVGTPKFWDVANIDDMSSVFDKKTGDKHPDISLWDVTNVTTMKNMFNGSTFDNDIPLVKRKIEDITVRVTLEDIKPTINIFNKIIENDGLQNAVGNPAYTAFLQQILGMPPYMANQYSSVLTQLTSALKITNTRTNEELDLTIGNNLSSEDLTPNGNPIPTLPTALTSPYPIKIVKEFTMKTGDILQIKTGDAFNNDIHFTIEEVVTDTIEKPRLYYYRTGIRAENLDLEIKMPSAWKTENVTTMEGMFKGGTFNQDIGSWDVCNVRDFSEMFKDNEEFDNYGSDFIDSWFYKRCLE